MGLFDTGLGDAAKRALGLVGDAAGAVVGFVAAHEVRRRPKPPNIRSNPKNLDS
jgi:hypothetical protein